MAIVAMNHVTVLAENLAVTQDFYVGVLGLKQGYRPDLGFPGVWLYAGDAPLLHIVAGRALPANPRGVLDHMAFTATDLRGMAGRLDARGIPYDLRRLPESGTWQLFCFDPNGARVELDFEAGEAAP
jgi:catechol 2,3-dioxygenase-like lactoylglutathione lyase family enzyme